MLKLLPCLLHVTRKGKSLNFSRYVTQAKIHRSSGAFLYVRNYLHSCIYLFLFRLFLRSCDRNSSLFFASEYPHRCPRSVLTKAKSLLVRGLEISPEQSSTRQKKCPDLLPQKFNGPGLCRQSEAIFERFYMNYSPQKIYCTSFNALSIMKAFSLNLLTNSRFSST